MSANPLHDRLLDRRASCSAARRLRPPRLLAWMRRFVQRKRSRGRNRSRIAELGGAAPGPDARGKSNEDYAKHVARDAYFWAWPLVNMYNRARL